MNSNLTMLIIDTTNFRSLHDMYFGIHIPDELWEQTMTSIPYMKSIIVNIITHNPDICTFMFYDFNILQRNILYRTFFELSLPSIAVTSLVIPNSLFIRIDLNHNLRQHIYNYATNTANYLTHTNIIDNNNFNLKHKLKLANLLFDIKHQMSDALFKDIMDTLNLISN